MRMQNLRNNLIIIVNLTWITAAVAAGVPTFFAVICYFGSWQRSDCGWLSAVPGWALMGAFAGFVLGCWTVYRTSKPWDFSTKRMQGRIQSHSFQTCELGCYVIRGGNAHAKEYIINTPIFAMSLFVSDKGWRTAGK